ncbi:hypothetical protein BJX63DRAFT_376616 [Aspergillus granulosus]|uniref:Zn(2)-C6 fungal-type domain-containing protein n=1 Tax=Aspergillus granulosus TaxID=176169 RepID=A0ABR4I3Y9_9EURO
MAEVHPRALPCMRLRDSCVSCAMAKIRCSKTRPSCSRCESHGIECQYFFTRHPGRKREHGAGHLTSCNSRNNRSSKPTPKHDTADGSQSNTTQYANASKAAELSPLPIFPKGRAATPARVPLNNAWTVMLPDDRDSTYPPDAFSIPKDFNTVPPLDDGKMNLLSTGSIDDPVIYFNNGAHTFELTSVPSISKESKLDIASPDASVITAESSERVSIIPNPEEPTATEPTATTTSTKLFTCACIPRALELLKKLSSTQPSPASSLPNNGAALYVLFQHKPNIAATRSMLSCSPCKDNSFLLAILSLVVLNIVERYATALQRQLHGSGSNSIDPGTISKLANNIMTRGRIPFRVIVSELCRLQSLVNLLVPSLLQSDALEKMEGDIRESLWGLAVDIKGRLRQYFDCLSGSERSRGLPSGP